MSLIKKFKNYLDSEKNVRLFLLVYGLAGLALIISLVALLSIIVGSLQPAIGITLSSLLIFLCWGGGVGCSVEHKFVSKLPKIKKDVTITHTPGYSARFIVPDTREGWCELMYRVYESYFVTGKSFTYSTSCLRGAGQPIKGFGGISSGPLPLIKFVDNINFYPGARAGKHVRPIDAADIITSIGEVVVSGNVRRSAILLLGDCWDKEFLTAKRSDLGQSPRIQST